ncbi:DNA polymerase beta domain protein region [Methanocaldococcus vulcanius M7]|uniref:protein adenylyltransferase n=1 Tax=Methanocaldococcus vulcanius (strain ATCC 700851 / DSM 12094 / M7) TaxID=579137 RepID=C9RFA7_METVM|nr:nucleotidyltransferase domain-containing protein [Methanocaldococcus vulcanius]ACX72259.1 DNA polymerase beta domain protein region [Methanocaldococcus vulcanius M7]
MNEKMLNKILNEFLEKCRQKFGDDLISIILFGSYARGTATEYSDIDLLVIVKNLPERRIDRHKVLRDEVLYFIFKYGVNISPILIKPTDLLPKEINPSIYGILTGYKIIYDKNDFWKNYIEKIKPIVKRMRPIFVDGEKEWKIADLI